MSSYSNGADGSCHVCGADTDEEWHALCQDCYAEEQGWRRRRDDDRAGSAVVTAVSDVFGDCVACGERRLLYPYRQVLRLCIDCLSDRRGGDRS